MPKTENKKYSQKKEAVRSASSNNKKMKKETKGLLLQKNSTFRPLFHEVFKTKPPRSVQDTLPFQSIEKDGLICLDDKHFGRTIEFDELNYQLALPAEQEGIFASFCEFLNTFDSDVSFQITLTNKTGFLKDFQEAATIERKNDSLDLYRQEFETYLKDALERGRNDVKHRKFITVMIAAEKVSIAKIKLERLVSDVVNHFQEMNVKATPLNGESLVDALNERLNCFEQSKSFSWSQETTKFTVKDFISPKKCSFKPVEFCRIGKSYTSTLSVLYTCSDLSDKFLADLMDLDYDITLSRHLQSMKAQDSLKFIKRKSTIINSMKIDEQLKNLKQGIDPDIIPPDLKSYSDEAQEQIQFLQSENTKLFYNQLLITVSCKSKRELDAAIITVQSIVQKYSCETLSLIYQQEAAYFSTLPLGITKIYENRKLPTDATAIQIPFTSPELITGGTPLYYGLNAMTKRVVMADKKLLHNPNSLILGTPGSGKSFIVKKEILEVMLTTEDEILICDPQDEYWAVVNELGGQVIDISETSKSFINPMDINLNYDDSMSDFSPLAAKNSFLLSMFELILGRDGSLYPEEKTILDRTIRKVYDDYRVNPTPENMPILEDLYNLLRANDSATSQNLAECLELYVHGSFNVFNHRTNVDIQNRLVCYNIKNLGTQIKKIGMLIVQDQVWNRVTENREKHITTRYYCDEFHLLLKDRQTAEFSVRMFKEFRKFNGIPTGITQNIGDLKNSPEVQNILENTPFIIMMNQGDGDRKVLQDLMSIPNSLMKFVYRSKPGQGILFFGYTLVPFLDEFPKDTQTYKLLTTKPEEVLIRGQ